MPDNKLEFQKATRKQLVKDINPEVLEKLSHLTLDIGIRNKEGKFIEVCPVRILIGDKENKNLRSASWARFVDLSAKDKALNDPDSLKEIKAQFLGNKGLNWIVNDREPKFSDAEEENLNRIFDILADNYLSVAFKNYSSFCMPLTATMDATKTLFPYEIYGK